MPGSRKRFRLPARPTMMPLPASRRLEAEAKRWVRFDYSMPADATHPDSRQLMAHRDELRRWLLTEHGVHAHEDPVGAPFDHGAATLFRCAAPREKLTAWTASSRGIFFADRPEREVKVRSTPPTLSIFSHCDPHSF